MPMTRGMPEPSRFGLHFADDIRRAFVEDAIRARGFVIYAGEDDVPPEPEPEPPEPRVRVSRTSEAARSVIADAMGVGPDELADLDIEDMTAVLDNDLSDPEAAMDALDAALDGRRRSPEDAKAGPGQSDGAYKVREGNWRERIGLPRKRKTVPPSRTREGRRAAHIRAKAERLGISYADAERLTQRRQAARRRPAAP